MVQRKANCATCVWAQKHLQDKQAELDAVKLQLEQQVEATNYWKNKYNNKENSPELHWSDIQSDSCMPEELQMGRFAQYLSNLLLRYPILTIILEFFIPASHKRKQHAKSTKQSWLHWSAFYQSFIVDVFMRSRSPKSIFRTNIALSAYLVLVKIPNSAWDLLQRLRILVSRDTIKNWMKSNTKEVESDSSTLLYSFDNCAIHLHKTHTRSTNHSKFMHLISHFVLEDPEFVDVVSGNIWNPPVHKDFGNWLQNSNYNSRILTKSC